MLIQILNSCRKIFFHVNFRKFMYFKYLYILMTIDHLSCYWNLILDYLNLPILEKYSIQLVGEF